jgi:hypothetical protein
MSNRGFTLPAVALIAGVALSGCAGPAENDTQSSAAPSPTAPTSPAPTERPTSAAPTEEPAGPTLAVTVNGTDVGPNAEQITVSAGEPITITFQTDRAGELHVHSKPEQYVEFEAGRSTKELTIETPGTVEIEEHDSEAVVAVVEVR